MRPRYIEDLQDEHWKSLMNQHRTEDVAVAGKPMSQSAIAMRKRAEQLVREFPHWTGMQYWDRLEEEGLSYGTDKSFCGSILPPIRKRVAAELESNPPPRPPAVLDESDNGTAGVPKPARSTPAPPAEERVTPVAPEGFSRLQDVDPAPVARAEPPAINESQGPRLQEAIDRLGEQLTAHNNRIAVFEDVIESLRGMLTETEGVSMGICDALDVLESLL